MTLLPLSQSLHHWLVSFSLCFAGNGCGGRKRRSDGRELVIVKTFWSSRSYGYMERKDHAVRDMELERV